MQSVSPPPFRVSRASRHLLLLAALATGFPASFASVQDKFECANTNPAIEVFPFAGTAGTEPRRSLGTGDFDGDGRPDLVAPLSARALFSGDGVGLTVHTASGGRMYFPFGEYASTMPYGLAVVDMDGDGKSDLVVNAPGPGTATAETYVHRHLTHLSPADFSGPVGARKVKMFADPLATGDEVAAALIANYDPAPLFSELGDTVLPANLRTALSSLVGPFASVGHAGGRFELPEDGFHTTGADGVIQWFFRFRSPTSEWEPLRLEVVFEPSPNGTTDANGQFVPERLWAATRATLYFPRSKVPGMENASQVVAARLPGNNLVDLIVHDAWYELQPRAGDFSWEYTALKRQSLTPAITGIGRDEPILRQIGTGWHLFATNASRDLQRLAFTGGAFASPVTVWPGATRLVGEFTLGEVTGDAHADLVFATTGDSPRNEVRLAPGLGGGLFGESRVVLPLRGDATDLKTMDFDTDGRGDILVADYPPGVLAYDVDARLAWLRGQPGATFATPLYFPHRFYYLDELMPTPFGAVGGALSLVVQTRPAFVSDPGGGTITTSGETSRVYYEAPETTLAGEVWETAGRGLHSLAIAPDGRIARLVSEANSRFHPAPADDERRRLLLVERTDAGVELPAQQVLCFPPPFANRYEHAFVFYGENDAPEIYVFDTFSELHRFTRTQGEWDIAESIRIPDGVLANPDFTFIGTVAATQAPDRSIHFVFYARAGTELRVLHARRATSGDWTWSVAATGKGALNNLEAFEYAEFRHYHEPRNLSVAVGSDGKVHVVYAWNRSITPITEGGRVIGSVVRSDLFYATDASGSWTSQTLLSPGADYGDAGLGASVAVAPDGSIAVAASYLPRVRTGSPGVAQLRYFVRAPAGAWQSSVISSASDGYVGGDGPRGTGLFPRLLFDEFSAPHIVFADHASQHFPSAGAKSFAGQVRHATRAAPTAGAWRLSTLSRRGATAAINFQTYDIDLAVGAGRVIAAATHHVWNSSRRSYLKQAFYGGPAPVDSDQDGIADALERVRGTSPDSADTDGDGIPDPLDPAPLAARPLRISVGAAFEGVSFSLSPELGSVTGITGLPPKLRYDSATRAITGVTGSVGAAVRDYTAQVSLKRADGVTVRVPLRITVEPLPAWAVGRFIALLPGTEGVLDLTAAPDGVFTGSLRVEQTSHPLRGALENPHPASTLEASDALSARAVFYPVKGDRTTVHEIRVRYAADGFYGVYLRESTERPLAGWRNPWTATQRPGWLKPRRLHAALPVPGEAIGVGHAVITLSVKGDAAFAARLPDGTPFTGSTFLAPDLSALVYSPLNYPGRGSAALRLRLAETDAGLRLLGESTGHWSKNPDPRGRERLSRGALAKTLAPEGGEFFPPASGANLLAASALFARFEGAGLADAAQFEGVPTELVLAQGPTGKLSAAQGSPATPAVSLARATGLLTGSFKLSDPVAGLARPVVRTVSVSGLYVPGALPGTGAVRGHFTLPELPATGEAATATAIRSGSLIVEP